MAGVSGDAAPLGRWLAGFSALIIAAVFLLVDPIAQDPAYHLFADTRALAGTPNFWNVASNLPFLVVGAYGLALVAASPDICRGLDWSWRVFYAGIALTAFGSGWYHWSPSNASLAWDRLTMTIGFAGLFAIVIGEYLSTRAARALLVPFLIVGVVSVVYWHFTEAAGAGDLRLYAIVQFLPVVLIPMLLVARREISDLTNAFWGMIGFYVAAKLFEQFDAQIFAAIGLSGHSLKHVAAGLAPALLIPPLRRRAAKQPAHA